MFPFTVGDVKPISVIVRPDDLNGQVPGAVVSGTWALVIAETGEVPIETSIAPQSGSLTVDARSGPSFITTAPITWTDAGMYVCRFRLVWNDDEVDNSLSARLTVNAPAT